MKWGNKRVLVTGGAGFVGSRLAKRLSEENAHVVVLDNFSSGKKEKIPTSCEIIKGDVSNKKFLGKIGDIDFVFHFGAPSSVILFNKNPKSCVHVTINGFMNILEWAKTIGIKKLIYPSSGSVYGNTPLPQSEDIQPKPANLYGICKLTCELIAKKYDDIPSVGLRIFAGYGPGDEQKGDFASIITLFLNSIMNNRPPVIYGNGEQSRDFVYIDDIVKAIVRSAEGNIKNGIINVGSGKAYSFNEIVDVINHLLEKNIKPLYIDKPVHYLENTLADIKKMKKLLGITPINLREGLKKYLMNLEVSI